MARRIKKITPSTIRRMVMEEVSRLRMEALEQGKTDSEKIDAEETEADELAGSIAQDIDYMKALKIHETRYKKRLKQIEEAKQILKRRISKKV